MQNREPTYPGRVTLTPVAGLANTYDMDRADQPLQQGTPLTKATFLKDATAALYGLGASAVPDDVLAVLGKYKQYWWMRRVHTRTWGITTTSTGNNIVVSAGNTVQYSNEITVDFDGNLALVNPKTSIEAYYVNRDSFNAAIANYWQYGSWLDRSNFWKGGNPVGNWSGNDASSFNGLLQVVANMTSENIGEWEFITSNNRNAYPDSGNKDGFDYQYMGVPLDNAVTAPKFESGSYAGTGTYGYTNKNSLTFPFSPVLLLISDGKRGFAVIPMAGENGVAHFGTTQATWSVTRDGNTISWYMSDGNFSDGSTWSDSADGQMNTSNTTYYYFAIG